MGSTKRPANDVGENDDVVRGAPGGPSIAITIAICSSSEEGLYIA